MIYWVQSCIDAKMINLTDDILSTELYWCQDDKPDRWYIEYRAVLIQTLLIKSNMYYTQIKMIQICINITFVLIKLADVNCSTAT